MIPTSLVAAVNPAALVLDNPVLCATTIPGGSRPLIRASPVVEPVIMLFSRLLLAADRHLPAQNRHSRDSMASGVHQLSYCFSQALFISASVAAICISATPN